MDIETTDEVLEKAVVAGLDGLDFITSYSTAEIAEAFNGIGPEFLTEGERERISKYLDLFTPAALIHDMRYTYNDGSRYGFYFANCEFRKNCLALANQKYSPFNWRRYRAHAAAEFLFAAVCSQAGWVAYRQAFTKRQTKESNENRAENDRRQDCVSYERLRACRGALGVPVHQSRRSRV